MSKNILKLALLSTLCLAPATTLVAQSNTNTVVYGRTNLQLSTGFVQAISGTGVVLTDLNGAPLQNNGITFKISSGVFSLQNFAGEIDHIGGLTATTSAVSIRIQNLVLDLSNPQAPVVTALFVANNVFYGRNPLFNLQFPSDFSLSPVQQGVLQTTNFNVTLAPAASSMLSNLLGNTLPAGTPIGTLNLYGVLAANANSDR